MAEVTVRNASDCIIWEGNYDGLVRLYENGSLDEGDKIIFDNGEGVLAKDFSVKRVGASPNYLRRKKVQLLYDIEGWEAAEEDSEDEKDYEERMRTHLAQLTEWEKKWGEYDTIQTLKYWLKEDLKHVGEV